MAKGIVHTGDPTKSRDDYQRATDGEHLVNGIIDIISKDQAGEPIYVPQNGRMVARLKLRDVTGAEGPIFSATPSEAFALVRAFGGTLPKIDPANRFTSKTLKDVRDAANAGGKTIKVVSAGGWVNRLPEAQPPDGLYTLKFTGAHRQDWQPGNLSWFESEFKGNITHKLLFDFEIVGDMLGKPSLWTGFPLSLFVNKATIDSYTTEDGEVKQYTCMTYAMSKSGGVPIIVTRFDNFVKAFAPDLYEYDWQTDPQKSTFGVNEVANPQYVVVDHALKANKTAIVHLRADKTSGRLTFDLAEDIVWPEPEAVVLDNETEQPPALYALITYIEKRWPEIKVFDQTGATDSEVALTEAGVQWAREYLGAKGGPWERMTALYPTEDRALGHLSDVQARRLLDELKSQYGDSTADLPW